MDEGNGVCFNDYHAKLGPLFASCQIYGADVLEAWAKTIRIDCPCRFVSQVPLILINNPCYFPVVYYNVELEKYVVVEYYPLLEYFAACINQGRFGFIVDGNRGNRDGSRESDFFVFNTDEIKAVTFGEIKYKDVNNNPDSDYTIVFNVKLSKEARLKAFRAFMNKETLRDDFEDIGPFIDAFRGDTHE